MKFIGYKITNFTALPPPSAPVRGDACDSFNTENNVTMVIKMTVFMVV